MQCTLKQFVVYFFRYILTTVFHIRLADTKYVSNDIDCVFSYQWGWTRFNARDRKKPLVAEPCSYELCYQNSLRHTQETVSLQPQYALLNFNYCCTRRHKTQFNLWGNVSWVCIGCMYHVTQTRTAARFHVNSHCNCTITSKRKTYSSRSDLLFFTQLLISR